MTSRNRSSFFVSESHFVHSFIRSLSHCLRTEGAQCPALCWELRGRYVFTVVPPCLAGASGARPLGCYLQAFTGNHCEGPHPHGDDEAGL